MSADVAVPNTGTFQRNVTALLLTIADLLERARWLAAIAGNTLRFMGDDERELGGR